jgi:hypothetical protein
LSYPLSGSAGRLCSSKGTLGDNLRQKRDVLGISAVLCRVKPAVACRGIIVKDCAQFVTVEQTSALKHVHNMHLHPGGIR